MSSPKPGIPLTREQILRASVFCYEQTDLTVDWLLTRYNPAPAQAVLYDATEMRIQVWDHFGTVFSYVKLFG
jgi:predicted nuclease of restriction endonuclease-like RecB superfamily